MDLGSCSLLCNTEKNIDLCVTFHLEITFLKVLKIII